MTRTAALAATLGALRRGKLSRDLAYSMGGFVVLAASGLIINVAITTWRDAAALGVFNLTYAIFIVASQLASWGVHYSVLRHTAYLADSDGERAAMISSAVAISVWMGIASSLMLWWAAPALGQAFGSAPTAEAVGHSALGLLLFPLNKVLLAYLNGLRRIRALSMLQIARYLSIMAVACAVASSDLPIALAGSAFACAEAVTTVAILATLHGDRRAVFGRASPGWTRTHFRFGTKGLLSGMFTEVNSRVDVLLIGLFLSDRATGIYSFAAMLADGLYQILAVVRLNFNPMLVTILRDRDWQAAGRLQVLARRYLLPAVLALAIALVAAYWVFAVHVVPGKGLLEGLASLAILLAGLVLVSALVPFDNLMMVSGHPGWQAAQQMTAVVVNVLACVWLLPHLGIEGAAMGTSLSYLTGVTVMLLLARRLLGWQLLTNRFTLPGVQRA